MLVYPIGKTQASFHAAQALRRSGVSLVDHPAPEVTHLLLDVPSFQENGSLRGGGAVLDHLERLPPNVTVVGGNLTHPDLTVHKTIDLLQDADYLAVNAAITADCALRIAAREMKLVFFRCPVLILGWGRIGKCLAQLLHALGAQVTVAARKGTDLAMLRALGYRAIPIGGLPSCPFDFRVVFNTVPFEIMSTAGCDNCIFIDLASNPGLSGGNVISARGLPGTFAPESSGELIAGTFLKLAGRK